MTTLKTCTLMLLAICLAIEIFLFAMYPSVFTALFVFIVACCLGLVAMAKP